MASAKPDLQLPSQAKDTAAPALRLVSNYRGLLLVTAANVCEQLAAVERPGVELATSRVASQRHTPTLYEGGIKIRQNGINNSKS